MTSHPQEPIQKPSREQLWYRFALGFGLAFLGTVFWQQTHPMLVSLQDPQLMEKYGHVLLWQLIQPVLMGCLMGLLFASPVLVALWKGRHQP